MAYKDSDQIANDSNYALGDYSFRIERSSVPGSTNDKIEAICTDKDGKNARKSIQVPSSTQLAGWYVEANDDTADVYAKVKTHGDGSDYNVPDYKDNGSYTISSFLSPTETLLAALGNLNHRAIGDYSKLTEAIAGYSGPTIVYITNIQAAFMGGSPITVWIFKDLSFGDIVNLGQSYPVHVFTTYGGDQGGHNPAPAGTPIYIWRTYGPGSGNVSIFVGMSEETFSGIGVTPVLDEEVDILIGRFAIDLGDAGGVGPGSDWEDPGDYDPDWEEGDPTHTLYVEVTGALSGRHNDPIVDPSYSYIPADKDTVKQYGCGGDGGHGGGGGAGASTVVVHKFATNQANSKEVTAIARRHGYGSGGGKGGKGGDGCILVYY